jgi:hypothetical protein
MSTVLTSPDISGIDKLFEIYKTIPDRDESITDIASFYQFLTKKSIERQRFLDDYCDYDFFSVGTTVILKLSPKGC